MFTGIVEAIGSLRELKDGRVTVHTSLASELRASDSIAVNGVCLTVLHQDGESFCADLSPETLSRTNLGALAAGSLVNLERPLLANSRLGGHIVQGHVDGVAEISELRRLDAAGNHWLGVRLPSDLQRYVAWKGSVALNGISLTVAALDGEILGAAIIPFTWQNTSLRVSQVGDRLNIECDLVARYLERLLARVEPPAAELTISRLTEEGF